MDRKTHVVVSPLEVLVSTSIFKGTLLRIGFRGDTSPEEPAAQEEIQFEIGDIERAIYAKMA